MRATSHPLPIVLTAALVLAAGAAGVRGACCYFGPVEPVESEVTQPSQSAFITWDPERKEESFSVQPRFEGNAPDFGMVIPTPGQPTLDEMPRDFFRALATLTVLEPVDEKKYRVPRPRGGGGGGLFGGGGAFGAAGDAEDQPDVRVLEAGIVGSLDYKVIKAGNADDLFQWLKDNKYRYAGDKKTLDVYVKRGWFFTVMKIDPKQMKAGPDGVYLGEVTPTRFTFQSDRPVYPLRITQISVKATTDALLYIQAPDKMDLEPRFSYQPRFVRRWVAASTLARPGAFSPEEQAWLDHVRGRVAKARVIIERQLKDGRKPARLEWAKRINADDTDQITGEMPYTREATKANIDTLRLLRGHVKRGQFVTKIRKTFLKSEMDDDLVLVRSRVADKDDNLEYTAALPVPPRQ